VEAVNKNQFSTRGNELMSVDELAVMDGRKCSAQVLMVASGANLSAWGAINLMEEMTTPARMLMYGKEASNRKQEIDRQHHTIPNQRP